MPYFPQPYIQYGGVWNLTSQSQAQGQTTWPVPPAPHLFSWGANSQGNLGTGNQTNYSSPKQIGSLTNWNNITGGNASAITTKTDGTLWAWGINSSGQLGLNNTTNYSSPVQVGALTNWANVSETRYFVLSTKTDGTLWSWGFNSSGQLGLGNTTYYSSPKQVGALTNWLSIAAGYYFCLATKTNGTLWSWGNNLYGQLGLNNITYYSSPKQVGSLTNWSQISAGANCCLAVKTDGTLWAWGFNFHGQLGLNNTTYYSSPKQVGALTNWSIATIRAFTFSLAIKTDGSLWSWGRNTNGQLGLGNTTPYSSPKQVGSATTWTSISTTCNASYQASFAISNGQLYSWGNNISGQLGLGNRTFYSSPKQVGSLTTWSKVGAQGSAVLAIAIT